MQVTIVSKRLIVGLVVLGLLWLPLGCSSSPDNNIVSPKEGGAPPAKDKLKRPGEGGSEGAQQQ
jgi:hypothetical protein